MIKMKAAGICGSDINIFNGQSAFAVYSNTMGHELAGEIYKIGCNVQEFNIGDHVVINNVQLLMMEIAENGYDITYKDPVLSDVEIIDRLIEESVLFDQSKLLNLVVSEVM